MDLGVWQTPLEQAPRLSERIGLGRDDLWIKRDDWIGLGGGGNKLRKLEHLCGRAIAEGATTLLASGAAQSNFCRLTAASARRLGLDAVLVLAGDGRDAGTGNLTLNGVFGADVRWAGGVDGEELDHAVHEVADALRAQGRRPAILPFGGSGPRNGGHGSYNVKMVRRDGRRLNPQSQVETVVGLLLDPVNRRLRRRAGQS